MLLFRVACPCSGPAQHAQSHLWPTVLRSSKAFSSSTACHSNLLRSLLRPFRAWGPTSISAPAYPQRPSARCTGGWTWQDPYWWLTDWQQAAPWVKQEQAYLAAARTAWQPKQQQMQQAIQRLTPPLLESPPERCGPYLYSSTPLGSSHAVVRWHVDTGREEVLLSSDILRADAEVLERRLDMPIPELQVGQVKLSADQQLLAYTMPLPGTVEEAVCLVRDVSSGHLLEDCLLQGVHSMEWSANGDFLLYTQPDNMGRPARVMAHMVGSNRAFDAPLLEERDPACFVSLSRTKDGCYLLLNSNSKLSSEVHLLPANTPLAAPPALLQQRRPGLEYFVEHHRRSGQLLLLTNANGAANYALMAVPAEQAVRGEGGMDQWQLLLPEDPTVAVVDMDVVADGAVLLQMKDARPQLTMVSLCSHNSAARNTDTVNSNKSAPSSSGSSSSSSKSHSVHCSQTGAPALQSNPHAKAGCHQGQELQVDTHTVLMPPWVTCVSPGVNQDYASSTYRVTLSAPTHPGLVCDYHLDSQHLVVLQDLSGGDEMAATRSTGGISTSTSSRIHCDASSTSSSSEVGDTGCNVTAQHRTDRALGSEDSPTAGQQHSLPGQQTGAIFDQASPLWKRPSITGVDCSLAWVTAADGTKVPLTLISSSNTTAGGPQPKPVLVLVYGAYGEVTQVGYQPYQLALLEQGWVVALPHVRGGGELGRRWHAAGRQQSKPNSVTDLLACIHYMVSTGITRPGLVAGHASSAGGLTLAAALQQQPQLFGAAVLEVPFLDLLGSMSESASGPGADSGIHMLIQHEFDEWGNPDEPEVLQMMQELCPYQGLLQRLAAGGPPSSTDVHNSGSSSSSAAQGVAAGERGRDGDNAPHQQQHDGLAGPLPALLLTAGDEDARVPYWMPLRYAAAARAVRAADVSAGGDQPSAGVCRSAGGSPVYVQLQEGGGHFGQGLMSQDADQEAEVLAFLLHHVGTPWHARDA